MGGEQVQYEHLKSDKDNEVDELEATERSEEHDDLIDKSDSILDEIDDLLEDDVEAFVRDFRQPNGQ